MPCLQADLLLGMELGPSLGLVKSSSLESLHNVMHLQIRRDSGSDLRNRETRNSFRRAVDHSYDENGRQQQQQRGVDGECSVRRSLPMTKLHLSHLLEVMTCH